MKTSSDRMHTTHVGSLPRPNSLIEFMIAEDNGDSFDEAAFESTLSEAVTDVVKHQRQLGIDCVSDGEFSKRGFAVYAHERLDGLEPTGRARPSPWEISREADDFPGFYADEVKAKFRKPTQSNMQMCCTGAITYKGKLGSNAIWPTSEQHVTPMGLRKLLFLLSRLLTSLETN